MDKNLQEKLLAKEKWSRGFMMLLLLAIKYFVAWLINAIALFQFATDLITGRPNNRLLEFSHHLNAYLLQIVSFLTFNSDTKPFPFTDLPKTKNS